MNLINYIKNKQGFVHFSIDDAWRIFDKKSVAFKFLESLYNDFGLVTTLYIFTEPQGKKYLHKIPSNHLKDYHWLKFGPHAPDWEHPLNTLNIKEQLAHMDYTYKQLTRIVGKTNLAENVRLHTYKGSKEVCVDLAKRGIKTLFTQDFWDNRTSYCLPPKSRNNLNKQGFYKEAGLKINFIKTGLRVEEKPNIRKDALADFKHHNFEVFFTHEEFLGDPKIQARIKNVLRTAKEKGIKLVY